MNDLQTNELILAKDVTHSAVQASTIGNDYSGSNIVDGYYTPDESAQSLVDSLMALEIQQDPWFEIDLEDDFCIEGMKCWLRPDRGKLNN